MIKEFEKDPEGFIARVKTLAEAETLDALKARAATEKKAEVAYAAAYRAIREGLGVTPFDTQVRAGALLDDETAVELATGEGKTFAAAFAAYYGFIKGEHVNIFTFNDYLARRDHLWLKPVYDLLGMSAAHVVEKTPRGERRARYGADVVYSTAKECGFDYLRDFLVFSEEERVFGVFGHAIADEADSILIDEARLPLVAAASVAVERDDLLAEAFDFVKSLSEKDYAVSPETESAYLTEAGAKAAERRFHLANLYDEENNALMSRINDSLKALYVLAEDRDYIVKNGEIRLIDAFTGRVSEDRHFPGALQSAAELKHGLTVTERGTVMATIAIQNFIRLYPRLSGMTGTALSAKDEFNEMYGLIVKRVEPNTPSARVDLPPAIYYDTEAKLTAVVAEIAAARERGQPVLVGTDSIEQSERLSALLSKKEIAHTVLNAKNDEAEAEIVRAAGKPGAITISTNMAGRGVDIKLGGADEKEREAAVAAGGLYVIGTFLAESERMNDQLFGRAARQGDPGSSRLFVSLDEPIMEKHKLKKLVGRRYPAPTAEEIADKVVLREVLRVRRISQGKALDERVRLMKFHTINEKHRQAVFKVRADYLRDPSACTIWETYCPDLLGKACASAAVEQRAALAVLNACWADYSAETSALREGIHLSAVGGKDPAEEYNIACEELYAALEDEVVERMTAILAEIGKKGAENVALPIPSKTWTYLLADNGDEFERRSLMSAIFGDEPEDLDDEADEIDEMGEADPSDKADGIEGSDGAKKGFFARIFGKK
ncbi:MAG: hypothetical protein NC084_11935 [Bacteroides sp.]|nr:preprotein translocase subunit SecA [Eubacterium sp.]MCM1419038.1 preprotein translocase subunit SecA [Roseburia sp.]MCM1463402.1 hypothetical protein [Bacteroides sp.]